MFARAFTLSIIFAVLCSILPAATTDTRHASRHTTGPALQVEEIASGLEVPWSIAFLPSSGDALFTERPGRLRVIRQGKLQEAPVPGLEGIASKSEIGLMSVVIHPGFAENGWVYLSHGADVTTQSEYKHNLQVTRYRFDGNSLVDPKVILQNVPAKHLHAGSRLLFGPDGMLYVTVGDAGTSSAAQKMSSLLGKTLRLDEDGNPPPDNPFVNQQLIDPAIWTRGHRNAQGLAIQPGSEKIFLAEHGPSDWDAPGGGDEINILRAGANYGWPDIHHRHQRPGMESPLVEWTPAIAPGGIAFHPGTVHPSWKGDLLVAALKGECLVRIKFEGTREVRQERLLEKKYGRIREVVVAPDESIWFATSNSDGYGIPAPGGDRILRLIPH